MKAKVLIGSAVVAALAATAFAFNPGSPNLKKFTDALQAADAMRVSFTVSPVGGVPSQWNVALQKPNQARIDGPGSLVIANGTEITVYDKKTKEYYTRPQTDATFAKVFDTPELGLWKGFFDANAFAGIQAARDGQPVTRRGMTLDTVDVTADANTSMRLFLDKGDGIARQAQITTRVGGQDQVSVMTADSVSMGPGAGADLFSFNPPQGAKEIKYEDSIGGVWITEVDKGLQQGLASDKLVILKFTATWCGPCQMMKRDVWSKDEFKAVSKDFILVEIDGDVQPEMMTRFNVSAYPTIVIVKGDGTEVTRFVGYRDLNEVLTVLKNARSSR